MKKLTLAVSVLSLSIVASFAQANTMSQDQKVSGFYVGGTVGSSKVTVLRDTEFTEDNPTESDSLKTSSESSFQLLGGYQFNRIVALELAYANFGSLKYSGNVIFKPTALTGQANLGYTFHSGWRPFALVGLSSLDLDQQLLVYADDSTVALRTGVGVEFSPASLNGLSLRATWSADWYFTDYKEQNSNTGPDKDYLDTNMLSNLSIGATYKF